MDSDFFYTLIPIAAGYWVYFDAYSHRIGTYRDERGQIRGNSPVWWGVLTLIICILMLPMYILDRRRLLAVAKEHPADSDKSIGILVMTIVSGLIVWYFHFR